MFYAFVVVFLWLTILSVLFLAVAVSLAKNSEDYLILRRQFYDYLGGRKIDP